MKTTTTKNVRVSGQLSTYDLEGLVHRELGLGTVPPGTKVSIALYVSSYEGGTNTVDDDSPVKFVAEWTEISEE